MKKVIDGKVYNTETAKKCGCYENIAYRNDFNWWSETLYQKKTGEFFLHGNGNANSRYSRKCGQNEWCGGEEIKPLTYEEAQAWAEKRLTGDEYELIFGAISENEETIRTTISTTASDIETIKRNAAKEGLTVSAYIVKMCAK